MTESVLDRAWAMFEQDADSAYVAVLERVRAMAAEGKLTAPIGVVKHLWGRHDQSTHTPKKYAGGRLGEGIASGVSSVSKLSEYSLNEVYLVEFNNGVMGIWKDDLDPDMGHNQGTAELLFNGLDDELGWNLTPDSQRLVMPEDVSIPQNLRGQSGVVQEFIEDSRPGKAIDIGYRSLYHVSDEGLKIGIMDYVTYNDDRHPGNWVVDMDDKIWAIDNGRTYYEWPPPGYTVLARRVQTFESTNSGRKAPKSVLKDLRKLDYDSLRSRAKTDAGLDDIEADKYIASVRHRVDRVLDSGGIPGY